MPAISVIVPVYKVEKYIHRCVDSILSQTFRDFELILVDDGSPDNCPAICDEYAAKNPRVVVIHQKNGGLSAARNAGLDWVFCNSDSQWLTFVDSDDWVHPEYLMWLHSAAEKHNVSISICGFSYAELSQFVSENSEGESQLWTPDDLYLERYVNATVAWGKLYQRRCFESVRYPAGKIHEDEFVTYKLLFNQEQVAFIPWPLYGYFLNEEGITKRPWYPARLDAFEALQMQIRFFEHSNRREISGRNGYVYAKELLRQYEHYISGTDRTRVIDARFRKYARFIVARLHGIPQLDTERRLHLIWLAFPGTAAAYHRLKEFLKR